MKSLTIFILFFIAITSIKAQNNFDSTTSFYNFNFPNRLSTNIDKQLNIYSLNSTLRFRLTSNPFTFNIYNEYKSTFIKNLEMDVKDENTLNFTGEYTFFNGFAGGINVNNHILSDNRKIELNNSSISNARFFVRIGDYASNNAITFSPFIGYAENKQLDVNDNGIIYGFEGFVNKYSLDFFEINSQLRYQSENISPRSNRLQNYNVNLQNLISPTISNVFNFNFSENKKDFYFAADSITNLQFNVLNNIQSRNEKNYLFQDNLDIKDIFNSVNLNLLGRISWRDIFRNTKYYASNALLDNKVNEFRLDFESTFDYLSDDFNSSLKIIYSERNENHKLLSNPGLSQFQFDDKTKLEAQKNNISKRTAISFNGNWLISNHDEIFFSFMQNKLVYNTPSEENFDDRDEILSIGQLKYVRVLSSYFNFFTQVDAIYNHIVYIFSEKSSNNSANYIIKYLAGGTYNGDNFRSTNSFEVSSNYTIYDFEDINPNYQSTSFRQFSFVDSTILKLSKKFSFIHYGYVKLSEQGTLNWKAFSTKPVRYLKEIFIEPKISFYSGLVKLNLGLRYFSLETFKYKKNEKIHDTGYESSGPVAEISIDSYRIANIFSNTPSGLTLSAFIWYEYIKADGIKRKQPNFNLNANWYF